MPADQLEEAILDQLLAVLEREPMVREAISEAFAELDADQPKRKAELERIGAERRRTSESLERYFRAFEEGTMPESACAPRIGVEREAAWAGSPARESLVDEIRVVSRAEIFSSFSLPAFDHRNEQYRYGDSNPGFRTENPAS